MLSSNGNYRKASTKKRSSIVTRVNPENNNPASYKGLKHKPGNSTYASVTKHGKKIVILTESLCSSIKINEFNPIILMMGMHIDIPWSLSERFNAFLFINSQTR